LRRCEKYLTLCEGVEFHQSGIVDLKWVALNTEKHMEINKRANQLGVKQILDPSKEFYSLQPDIAIDIIGPTPVEVLALQDLTPSSQNRESWQQRFLKDGKYLTVKIDVTQRKSDIINQIKIYLDYYRDLLGPQDKRHTGKMECWQVYDMIKEGRTHTEIIERMWPDEYQKGIDEGDSKIKKEYQKLVEKYRKQGLENFHERAYQETHGKCEGSLLKLYVRVRDNKIKAERKIEELRLRFKESA
jgi:hypothetical protein